MGEVINSTGAIASFIGSLTVVGGALIWIYNKFIGTPREKRRQKEETKRLALIVDIVTKENKPLNEAIKQLTEWLNESKKDRENLNRIAKENKQLIQDHEKRLDRHHDRLIVLETKNDIKLKKGC